MIRTDRLESREGFTLVEILVCLILLSLLVTAVYPPVTQQAAAADAPRLISDLANIRSGIETLSASLRTGFPADLEDLAHRPSSAVETDFAGTAYGTRSNRWNGPYLDVSLVDDRGAGVAAADAAFESGFGGRVLQGLVCFRPSTNMVVPNDACDRGDFVSVVIEGLEPVEFTETDVLFDGQEAESATGSFRRSTATDSPAYYLAVPWRP